MSSCLRIVYFIWLKSNYMITFMFIYYIFYFFFYLFCSFGIYILTFMCDL